MKHSCRKQNIVVDVLARSRGGDTTYDHVQILTVPPLFVEELLEAVKLGTAFYRKVEQNYVTDINLATYQHDLGDPTIRLVITLFNY